MNRIALPLDVETGETVSALLLVPDDAQATFVFAHGAGAGMTHPFMQDFAERLAVRGIATLRFDFPFMERRARRVDPPATAHRSVRAAVELAARRTPGLPLFAGGKSFGGRMTSGAQAEAALPGVHGLVFVGFPLHPEGRPSTRRADHLDDVSIPMLFLQGTRDALADPALMGGVVRRLGERATLAWFDGADHAFHVSKKSGTDDLTLRDEMVATTTRWIAGRLRP